MDSLVLHFAGLSRVLVPCFVLAPRLKQNLDQNGTDQAGVLSTWPVRRHPPSEPLRARLSILAPESGANAVLSWLLVRTVRVLVSLCQSYSRHP